MKNLFKKFDEKYLIDLKKVTEDYQVFKTGNVLLDDLTGIGGIPKVGIIELFGLEATGKSTLCYQIAIKIQKEGGRIILFDFENAFSLEYAKKLGLDLFSDGIFLVSRPETLEKGFDILNILIEQKLVNVAIIDSLTASSTIQEQSEVISRELKKLAKSNICLLIINQLREKINKMGVNIFMTSGGYALKRYASMRLELKEKEKIIDDNNNIVGKKINITVVKNRFAPPYRSGKFILYNNIGFISNKICSQSLLY